MGGKMKQMNLFIIFSLMFLLLGATRYSLIVHESFMINTTEVSRCSFGERNYVLIYGVYEEKYRSLVITETKEKTTKNVYGDIYLKYCNVKHARKRKEQFDGKTYDKIEDNEQGIKELAFVLTDYNELKNYKSFKFLDNNKGRVEKFEDEEIGGKAGYLMQINAEDFIDYLGGLK